MPVRVNGVVISDHVINAEVQYHPAPSREAAARALVVRELLLEAAATLGIEEPDPVDERGGDQVRETREEGLIRTVIAREVKTPEPDEAACRRYYEANRRRFKSPDLYEGAHILFAADPGDKTAMAEAKQKAEAVIARVLEDPGSFGRLAGDLSDCPSSKQGGNLGQLTRGSAVPEFETFLFNLEEGQICPVPIESRFGYHVARLDRRVPGRQLPFDMVKGRIADYLRERVWRKAVSQYLNLLIGQADIEGLDLKGASSPLVQ